jgi:hypothetical protein
LQNKFPSNLNIKCQRLAGVYDDLPQYNNSAEFHEIPYSEFLGTVWQF